MPGVFKARYGINEVVTGIMMNYISLWSVYYFVQTFLKGIFETESAIIKPTASLRVEGLTKLFHGSSVNLGLFLAIAVAVLVWWILEKTTFGYELKAVGFNIHASKYAGIKVNRSMIFSMMISGALAGLAGAVYYLGYTNNIKVGSLPQAGGLFMNAATKVPNELVPIIVAIIVYFAATSLILRIGYKELLIYSKRKKVAANECLADYYSFGHYIYCTPVFNSLRGTF